MVNFHMTIQLSANSLFNPSSAINVCVISSSPNTLQFQSNTANVITIDSNSTIFFNGTSAMVLPVGNTIQRPVNPVNGMMRFNSFSSGMEAYVSGSWLVVTTSYSGYVLSVAGGGGGGGSGSFQGGGGGAGGYINGSIALNPGTIYYANVGMGGKGGDAGASQNGASGKVTTFGIAGTNSFYAYGGGGGGSGQSGVAMSGQLGGSGGGQGYGQYGSYGYGITGQGFDGGGVNPAQAGVSAGGGGASQKGGLGTGASANGGDGILNPIVGSTQGQLVSGSYWVCGGGGGGQNSNGQTGALGGKGGGGNGGYVGPNYAISINAQDGLANTGAGGGGACQVTYGAGVGTGGRGANGVIVLSVPSSNYNAAVSTAKGPTGTFTQFFAGGLTNSANSIITWTYPGGTYVA